MGFGVNEGEKGVIFVFEECGHDTEAKMMAGDCRCQQRAEASLESQRTLKMPGKHENLEERGMEPPEHLTSGPLGSSIFLLFGRNRPAVKPFSFPFSVLFLAIQAGLTPPVS